MAQVAGGYQRVPVSAAALNTQVVIPAQQTTTVAVAKPRQKYKGVLHVLGIMELLLGCLSCALAFVTLVTRPNSYYGGFLTYTSQGIWCGTFLIVSGILGIKAKSNPSVCMYNANMAVSIVASNFMGVLIIMSSIAATVEHGAVSVPFHGILAVIGFAGMIITIIHSAYCCAGVCCRANRHKGIVMYMPQQQFVQQPQQQLVQQPQQQFVQQPQQMIQLANGQFMMIPSKPIMAQGYPVTSMPVSGTPITYQPAMPMASPAPQQVLHPSTSTGIQQQAQMTKEQDSQMQGTTGNPPNYSILPN